MTLKSNAKFKKNWLVISNMTWGIWLTFIQPLKSPKLLLWWTIFVKRFKLKKYIRVIFHDTEQWCKPDLVISKLAWGIGWTSIRAPKSLKNCTIMGSFCPNHIMFQLKNFRGIMYQETERWCKILRETALWLEK